MGLPADVLERLGYQRPDVTAFTLAGHDYSYCGSEPTTFTAAYVSDWDDAKAQGESWQNALDEALMAGSIVRVVADADTVTLYDNGRGVDRAMIVLVGESGKRDNETTVGTQGEGEVMSFLVSARNGIRKTMASQTWACRARFAPYQGAGKPVLLLDYYQTDKPRTGTVWEYHGWDVHATCAAAVNNYVRHEAMLNGATPQMVWGGIVAALEPWVVGITFADAPKDKARLIPQRGSVYTRGMYVTSTPYDVACSYNVRYHPGRDRTRLNWSDVQAEAQAIWALECSAAALAHVFDQT